MTIEKVFQLEFHPALDYLYLLPIQPLSRALPQMVVNHCRLRVVDHPPRGFLHSIAEINLLEIEEESLVEQLGPKNSLPADHHATPEGPVHLPHGIMVPVGHQVIS
jgi:hypothetical protein